MARFKSSPLEISERVISSIDARSNRRVGEVIVAQRMNVSLEPLATSTIEKGKIVKMVDLERGAVVAAASSKRRDAIRVHKKAKFGIAYATKPRKPIAASLASLPIWVAAEIMSLLDLASVLALTLVSRGVRAVFRTPASAAILMPLVLKSACAHHRVDLANDSADVAWGQLKWAFQFAWTNYIEGAKMDCAGEDVCVADDSRDFFSLERLHRFHCCRALAHAAPARRRIALRQALGAEKKSLHVNSNLGRSFIAGSLRNRSLHEVVALMACHDFLFSISNVVYSRHRERLCRRLLEFKFGENVSWSIAAEMAIQDGVEWSWGEFDDGDHRFGPNSCWNCGEQGHFARDCWHH